MSIFNSNYEKDTLKLISNHIGINSPLSGSKISSLINLKTKGIQGAEMRNIIHKIRLRHYPVCATFAGYYYAMTIEELEEFRKILRERIDKQIEIWKALGDQETISRIGKQPDFPTEDDELRELSKTCL
jgi:hypothetical protein